MQSRRPLRGAYSEVSNRRARLTIFLMAADPGMIRGETMAADPGMISGEMMPAAA